MAKPPLGSDLAGVDSVNTAGSRGADPYTLVLDFTTSRCTLGDFWQAPSSCMVPMTLVSFTVARLPLPRAVAVTSRWTTVSAPVSASTRAMVGCRMSAWMNSAPPRWCSGRTASTATTVDLRVTLDPPDEPAPS